MFHSPHEYMHAFHCVAGKGVQLDQLLDHVH